MPGNFEVAGFILSAPVLTLLCEVLIPIQKITFFTQK